MFPVRSMQRQFGGTFLGIIIGVVIGLGAALAVAVYVTKVPIPFMNRNSSRSADQDAQEAQKNRDWDPNSVLGKRASGGKSAGDESGAAAPAGAATGVAAPQAPRPDPTIPLAPPPASAAATPSPAPRSAASSASSDPLGDLARARSGGAPVAAPATSASAGASTPGAVPAPGNADAFDYLIQAGAFRTEADADAQRARLAIMGWEARVSEREQAGRTVYRVRIGPFVRRDDAERLKDTLDGSGMDSTLVRVQR